MGADPGENTAKRRKLRKGTHSCLECRRRKVKCIFASRNDAICVTCQRRGTKCISQTLVDGLDEPGYMAGETEKDAEQNKDPDILEDDSVFCVQPNASVSSESQRHSSVHATTALLDGKQNHTSIRLQTKRTASQLVAPNVPPTPASSPALISEAAPYPSITRALQKSLPPRNDCETLIKSLSSMSIFCYQSSFKLCSSWANEMAKVQEQVPIANLLYSESHPVLLARQMLLFAIGLQYLPHKNSIPGLTKHHHTIMEQLSDSVIRLVNANDVLLGTLEGLENLILEGFYHMDGGNIRRSWITMRRAVMTAQLLGLHRPGHYRFKVLKKHNDLNPTVMWACVVSTEQYLSLLLGLPTSTGGINFTIPRATSTSTESGNLPVLIPGVVRKIIERNQIQAPQEALIMTQEIDQELLGVIESSSRAFWRPLHFAGLKVDSAGAFWETRRAWDHIFYYSLVTQLHLPYMLNPKHASQGIYSRIACASASREVLIRQIAIRTFNPVTAGCRMGDFVALIAGMTLMIAHILGHCNKGTDNLLIHQRAGDRATVERALECMTSMSELHEDALAAKCAALLKDLLDIEAGNMGKRGGSQKDNQSELTNKVPYVGAIRIARDFISIVAHDTDEEKPPHEGVTIGGFGSIHVKAPCAPDLDPDVPMPGISASQATVQVAKGNPAGQNDKVPAKASAVDVLTLSEETSADASAGIEEWLFQGFDTAFFDLLMSGAGEQPLNNTGSEGWESTGAYE